MNGGESNSCYEMPVTIPRHSRHWHEISILLKTDQSGLVSPGYPRLARNKTRLVWLSQPIKKITGRQWQTTTPWNLWSGFSDSRLRTMAGKKGHCAFADSAHGGPGVCDPGGSDDTRQEKRQRTDPTQATQIEPPGPIAQKPFNVVMRENLKASADLFHRVQMDAAVAEISARLSRREPLQRKEAQKQPSKSQRTPVDRQSFTACESQDGEPQITASLKESVSAWYVHTWNLCTRAKLE